MFSAPLGERRSVAGDGIDLSVSVAGHGPLVVLMHGWPEQSLSWRHQVPALVAAGYQVATPDMRGYGKSGKPADPAAYSLKAIGADIAAIADALGHRRWVSVGHDWGALAAWRTALAYPDRVAAVLCMSVPHTAPPPVPLLQLIDQLYPDRFFYIRHFQEQGVAEEELETADTKSALKQIFYAGSGDGARTGAIRHAPRGATLLESYAPAPDAELSFMPDDELDQYAAAFRAGGWRGPLNWYRNFDTNAADANALGDSIIHQPSGFIYGEHEAVLKFWPGQLESQRRHCPNLRMERQIPGAGHWVQQEAPDAVNAALLEFLGQVQSTI